MKLQEQLQMMQTINTNICIDHNHQFLLSPHCNKKDVLTQKETNDILARLDLVSNDKTPMSTNAKKQDGPLMLYLHGDAVSLVHVATKLQLQI